MALRWSPFRASPALCRPSITQGTLGSCLSSLWVTFNPCHSSPFEVVRSVDFLRLRFSWLLLSFVYQQ